MDEEGENQKRKLGDTYQFIQLVTESETIYSQSFSSFKCNLMRSPETKSQEDQLKVVEMFNTGKRIFGAGKGSLGIWMIIICSIKQTQFSQQEVLF